MKPFMFGGLGLMVLSPWVPQKLEKPVIDGKELIGVGVACEYMKEKMAKTDVPFKLEHYFVRFEGNFKYLFNPKLAPGEKPSFFMKSRYGWTVEIKVDPKTMKVLSAEAQP